MKNSIKKLVITSILLIVILTLFFIGIIFYLFSDFCILIGIVSVFSILTIVICTVFVVLLSRNVNNTLGALSQTIESIIDDNPLDTFSTIEDTMLSKLQSQMLRLTDILKSHSIKDKKEKEIITGLISDISHQLKTPLANLNIYNSLLLDEDLDKDKRAQFTKNMANQVEKLNWLMESLIKMSRLEAGIIKLNLDKQMISQTVLQAISMLTKKAEDKGIDIIFTSEDIEIVHDSKWTQEAIFNILDNAVKYSDNNTKIKISIMKYELFCRIDIKDEANGIIESDINKVFTRFYRGETTKDIEGVGIGLFLARKIISAQDGYIKVTSTLGKGSIFSVFLPLSICQPIVIL